MQRINLECMTIIVFFNLVVTDFPLGVQELMVEVSKNYTILITLRQVKMHNSKWSVLPVVRNQHIYRI